MKKLAVLLFCFCLASCYFGQNESCEEIAKNFYLAKWDQNTWISYTKEEDSIFDTEKIIIGHDVFAIGNNEEFIIGKQHPCENKDSHFIDYDSLKPNRAITRYFIIDIRNNNNYKLFIFNSEEDFYSERSRFGIPKNLPYKFYDISLE